MCVADAKLENRQNYLQPPLGVHCKAEKWDAKTHRDAPKHSFYCNGCRRELTFKEWPSNLKQTH